MDDDKKNVPRKVRFAPKAPPRRERKLVLPKVEKFEETDAAKAEELMQRFHEASVKVKPKAEQKPKQAQVAFGRDGGSSMKSYGALKNSQATRAAGGAASGGREIKEYKEPWDYYTNYPVTLPLRRPYSGDPELLDEEEFGETLENIDDDESSINSAIELGLMEENLEANMLFLQLPENMPVTKQSVKEGLETSNTSKPVKGSAASRKVCNLNELPAGFMGKMLVYRSGAVKLKLGDILYNVSAGLNNVFAQDAVAINTEEKHCCVVGELNKRAIVSPDLESILDSFSEL
ncbi:DNA-directed RNA polymerase III subunit RPC4 [Heracleum sosnowskyi]|uniref:DNA-directed RNA polymerase III subunit RPC4 n=1 Tax=Heracleum sosnowskyi TaxID=360622 RepID=A0AAD8I3H2_9APIA|nr:DNA-directed RNA polymerase III subunit RPC4 [Heracleum sosnowskyi]